MLNITFDPTDILECERVSRIIAALHTTRTQPVAPEEEQGYTDSLATSEPPPEKKPETASKPTPEKEPEKAPEPVPAPDEQGQDITLDMIQTNARDFLMGLEPANVADAKSGLVSLLENTFGVKSTADLKDDQLVDAYNEIQGFIKENS